MNEPFSPRAAQRDYPLAWEEIERQIIEVQEASNHAAIIPLGVRIIEEHGIKMIEVACLTDLVHDDDDEMQCSGMSFVAAINTPSQQSKMLH